MSAAQSGTWRGQRWIFDAKFCIMSTPDEWQPVLFTLVNGGYIPDSDNFSVGACTPSPIVQPRRLTLQVIPPSDVKSCGFWESGGRTKVRIMNDTFWFLGELAFVYISRTSNRFTWMKQTMPAVPWLNLVAPFTCRAKPIQFSTPRTQWHTFVTALIRGKKYGKIHILGQRIKMKRPCLAVGILELA